MNLETDAMPPTDLDRLTDIIDRMSPVLEPPQGDQAPKRAKRGHGKRRADREDTSYVSVHLPRDLVRRLKVVAAEQDTTSHELLTEAVSLLLLQKK